MAAPKTDTSGQVVQPRLITHLGDGPTPLTNRDISTDLQVLTDLKKGAQNADGIVPETGDVLKVLAALQGFNGTNFDRWRNNEELTLLALAARTASTDSAIQTNYNHRGVMVFFRITAAPGVDTVQLRIRGRDLDGNMSPILILPAALSATGTYTYLIYPGITEGAYQGITDAKALALPRRWYVNIYHNGSGEFTYEVYASMIP